MCWVVSCFVPNIPHTANIIHGEKGAAKSTVSTMLKSLIDPSALETLTLQNNQRTLAVNLQSHWLLPFDNVSFINEEVSDMLCRAITGGGIQQRKLHTNSEDVIFTFQRCIIINGINNVATRADLLDRSILTELVRISDGERKELSEIMCHFEADKAEILGGIFDTLAKAMNIYPMVKLQNLPRMADFARWGYAIGEALGGFGKQFLEEYAANRQIQNEEAITCDPVATLIVEFMRGRDYWSGLCAELYRKLSDIAPNHGISTSERNYPSDAIRLAKRFKQIKSNLEAVGLQIEKIEPRKDNGQHYSLKRVALSTVTTEACDYEGLETVDKDGVQSLTTASDSVSTADKAFVSVDSVDTVNAVDKKTPLEDGWVSVSDKDFPPEFLKPIQPSAHEKSFEQIEL